MLPSGAMGAPAGRIRSLDVLRGVAVLAMAVANVPLFASVTAARANPIVHGDLHGWNWWAWLSSDLLFDGRFTAIYGMTFGAGLVILAERYEQLGLAVTRLHLRRMAGLLLLGVLHAYLVWHGDFLVTLAISGAIAFLYYRWPARRLLALGIAVMAMGSLVGLEVAWRMPSWEPEKVAQVRDKWSPPPVVVAREIEAYRSGWLEQMSHRVPTAFDRQTAGFVSRPLWQMTGLMIVGMGLFKLGVFTAARSMAFYSALAAGGFGLGVPVVLYAIRAGFASGWSLRAYLVVDALANYWGGFLVGLGWVGVVMLLCKSAGRLEAFAAVGRLALTNYLLQSLLFTTIFYGHGLGLFARIDRAGQLAIAIGVAALELGTSVLWMRYFSIGPVEWAWRSLSLGRRLPVRAPLGPVGSQDEIRGAREA